MNHKIIGQGAEAIIEIVNDRIVRKTRITKLYRLPIIDERLRKLRTRSEAKILQTLAEHKINVPKVISSSDKEKTIELEYISGKILRDVFSSKNMKKLCLQLGENIAQMHNLDIIHADLTTSNMILSKNKIFLIDFGLSYFSQRTEDKAVDLHLLSQAISSYHFGIAKKAMKVILSSYEKFSNDKETINRLLIVEHRGKNKH